MKTQNANVSEVTGDRRGPGGDILTSPVYVEGAEPGDALEVKILSIDLARYIIEGSKDGLIDDLERKRAEGAGPLAIINGPLMKGMDEVGRLFNNNELTSPKSSSRPRR